jgi:uncharacterized membrane protein
MDFEKTDYLATGLFLLIAGLTLYGFLNIQGDVAVHFGPEGEPDRTMGKLPGLLFLPAISLGVFLLLNYIPKIDPLEDNVEDFKPALEGMAVALVAFMAYVQGLIIAWNLGIIVDISRAIVPAIAGVFYAAGLLLKRAERNWFIGIRTPWTLSSDEVWRKTHQRAAPLFRFAAVFSLGAIVYPDMLIEFTVVPAVILAIYSTLYSFIKYRELEGDQ